MKLTKVETAKLVRDAAIEAMDALNAIVVEADPLLLEDERNQLRFAVGRSMSAILDNIGGRGDGRRAEPTC